MNKAFKQYQDHIVDGDTQKRINEPLKKDDDLEDHHKDFLKLLIEKLESKELDPLDVNTLFNKPVYEKLHDEEKEKTDMTAFNIMSIIKQIENLWNLEHQSSFQIQNLVDTVFQMKSQFEDKHGDVFVI